MSFNTIRIPKTLRASNCFDCRARIRCKPLWVMRWWSFFLSADARQLKVLSTKYSSLTSNELRKIDTFVCDPMALAASDSTMTLNCQIKLYFYKLEFRSSSVPNVQSNSIGERCNTALCAALQEPWWHKPYQLPACTQIKAQRWRALSDLWHGKRRLHPTKHHLHKHSEGRVRFGTGNAVSWVGWMGQCTQYLLANRHKSPRRCSALEMPEKIRKIYHQTLRRTRNRILATIRATGPACSIKERTSFLELLMLAHL